MFWSLLGQWSFKKNCFWDLLTFTLKFWVYVHSIKPILGQVQVRQLLYNAYVLKPVRDTAGLKFHFSFFVVSQWKPRYPLLIMLRRLSMPAADQERLLLLSSPMLTLLYWMGQWFEIKSEGAFLILMFMLHFCLYKILTDQNLRTISSLIHLCEALRQLNWNLYITRESTKWYIE